ncbi:MAG TPA: SDR family NAD(P)-dependent oxidoreductase [Polyangia bacterium]
MANEVRFDGRVAVITGAGNGLGRAHALLLAARGAKVVVNDLGGSIHGGGKSSAAADKVVDEIKAAGGEAVANYDSVEDGAKIVQCALDHWQRIDIVVNNAGILRDTSFQKMSDEDWDLIYRVHVLGSYRVTKAAWSHMRDAGYGRIVFTASAAGIYGNFGQANYAMAKLGLVGLSNTLALEGHKKNVLVNTIAPIAGSRLTETVLPKELIDALSPEYVSPLVAWLCSEGCEDTGGLYEVGGGFFGRLRWQRSAGKTFRTGRAITPEQLERAWPEIAGFDKVTYPSNINESMQPIISNLGKKSRGGNELIDVDEALAAELPEVSSSYDERDLALYALGVGAAQNPLGNELAYVYERGDSFQALPTFAVVPALKVIFEMAQKGTQAPGLHYGFDRILHGEQYTEVKRPLPPHAKLKHKVKIKDIYDKGKGAVVITAITTTDESGDELAYNEVSTFVRGAGGWGGDRGPSTPENVAPERAPDAVVEEKTSANQALLYRLSGDWNPLHADPAFAKAFGFEKPILHGLCSFGFAARAVINSFAKGDARIFKSVKVRFADSVFPGETLVTEMWKESPTRVVFRTRVKERDKVVISNAAVELYAEIPKPKARPAAAATATAAGAAGTSAAPTGLPTSTDIFTAVGLFLAKNPELAKKVQTVFQWKLTAPESTWYIDAKNGGGACKAGNADKPDVTLELADADFLAMCTGQADPQKLYFGGKLKISGNVMASQKLTFLQKIDPSLVVEAMQQRGGGAAAPAVAAPAAAASGGAATSAQILSAIGAWLSQNPDTAKKVQTVFQWKLTSPESAWVLDVKNGAGSCAPGVDAKADVTLELSDADFIAMATGKEDAQKMYFGGRLKISGNVMASQKLGFLKKIDPASIRAAAAAAPAASAPAPTASAPKPAVAPAFFKALAERLQQNPSLASEVGQVLAFKVHDPERAFVVDLGGSGVVREGSDAKAVATFTVADGDLATLAQKDGARDLFQRGKLRVDGDVRLAHKLSFLNGLA